ncbi:MAG TPA: S-layer homology domain-containing protein [Bacillota bacterium]|nr:S-layer homology domain-containing protein [Bacillota bacterium]
MRWLAVVAMVLWLGAPAGAQGLSGYGWASAGVHAALAQGWMSNLAPGEFGPGVGLTKAEAVAVLGRVAGWPADAGTPSLPFQDAAQVPPWAAGYMSQAYYAGWLHGVGGGQLAPNQSLTWASLSVLAARALELPAAPEGQVASLLSKLPNGPATPAWAQQAVAQLVQARLLAEPLLSSYQPEAPVGRAALAQFIYQVQQVMPDAMPGMAGSQVITGTVVALAIPLSVTVRTPSGVQTIRLSAQASVVVGELDATLADLQVGQTVSLLLNRGAVQRAILIQVT